MAGLSCLSSRERKVFFTVVSVVMVCLIDLFFRSWCDTLAGIGREEKVLRTKWGYVTGLLARSQNIEERYSGLCLRFPKLFEDGQDPARLMAELDEIAKAAGVQINTIRPAGPGFRIEMALRGSWPQVMRFLQAAESQEHLFQFPSVEVHHQERIEELEVAVVAQK